MNKLIIAFLLLSVAACTPGKKEEGNKAEQSITSESYGVLSDSTEVTQFTLTNANGLEMKVITYGGIITSLKVPNRDGKMDDIVLGFDNLKQYEESNPYFGAIIGRYGNRIAKGKFTLDSTEYYLVTNNLGNHLHGGTKGFDKVVWSAEEINQENGVGLSLSYTSPDMEEGYPGNLDVVITYLLTNDNILELDYKAKTDRKTVVNLTQHTYFNLNGMKSDILDHELMINASSFLPVDSTLIPTGVKPVSGTPFDFTTAKKIGKDIGVENEQLKFGTGFDHCWVINEDEASMKSAATVYDSASGRFMEVFTTEPGIQFYAGNFLNSVNGKNGIVYNKRFGLCLETQHYPDSPNQSEFPTVVLSPDQEYHTTTSYKFSVK